MELYFKDLISEERSLEKLVDNLTLIVQGADDLAEAAGANVAVPKEEITHRLARLKESCLHLKQNAIRSALAADKLLHQYPYSSIGFAFGLGLVGGIMLGRHK
jgi:ElaB/YqjD/DUF883 family membrane-anchored ribosome-binding protein